MAKINPLSLKVKNFQCYSNAEMHFNFRSALIVGERDQGPETSNGSGKTSIFEAITWCLFNECKQRTLSSVINRNASECEVQFTFESGGDIYNVTRRRRGNNSDVVLEKNDVAVDSDVKDDLNCKIQEAVGSNYEAFVATSYFMQRSISEILSGTPASRQKLLKSFLNLTIWDSAEEFTKKKVKRLEEDYLKSSSVLQENKRRLDQINLPDELAKLERLRQESTFLDSEEKAVKESLSKKQILIGQIIEKRRNQSAAKVSLSSLEEKIKLLEKNIELVSEQIEDLDKAILKKREQIPGLEQEGLLPSGSSSMQMTEKLRTGLSKAEALTTVISKFKPNDICSCCGKTWSEHEEKVAAHNADIEALESIKAKIDKFKVSIAERKTQEAKSENANNQIRQINDYIENQAVKVFDAIENQRKLQQTLEAAKKMYAEQKREVSSVDMEEMPSTVAEQEKLDTVQRNKNNVFALTIRTESTINDHDKISASVASLLSTVKQQEQELGCYRSLVTAFGRKGIQAVIMESVIDNIVKVTNKWLAEFCYDPMSINIITQKPDKKETFDIEISTSSGVCSFESLSGGEAFKVAFSMRLALAAIQPHDSSILLLDEVSSSLDKNGLEHFVKIVHVLEKHFKILVITHDDQLKEKFHNIVTVRRLGSNATIEQSI